MDKNLKNAKSNLTEAKDDLKEMIDQHYEAAKKNIGGHVDDASDATKGAIVDMANSVSKAAQALSDKFSKDEEPVIK